MIEVTVETDSALDRVLKNLRVNEGVSAALRGEARDFAAVVRRKLRAKRVRPDGSGRSQPGDPPARETGKLARSIRYRAVRRSRGLAFQVLAQKLNVGDSSDFRARFLETGAEAGGKRLTVRLGGRRRSKRFGGHQRVAPRPFLTTELAARERRIAEAIARAVEKALNEAARAGERGRQR